MAALAPFRVQKYDILSSNSSHYLVLDLIGEGCFGAVAKCRNLTTHRITAVKIDKSDDDETIQNEINMLKKLRALDPEKKNLVKFIEHFKYQGMSCLAFEMLDRSLIDLVDQRQKALSFNEVRPVVQQLLVAFDALKSVGIIHTDLKPDNVMLVSHQVQPFMVKLIDFGLAYPASKAEIGMIFQAEGYRAPEVYLGLPVTEAIDMWGLGCVLMYLHWGLDLFPWTSQYDTMRAVCQLLGQPEDHLLDAGRYTTIFFKRECNSGNARWRLKTAEEYMKTIREKSKFTEWSFHTLGTLEEGFQQRAEDEDDIEYEDKMAFLDLLKRLLDPNAATRITPSEALMHSFVTMDHLKDHIDTSSYAEEAATLMFVCHRDDSDDYGEPLSKSEAEGTTYSNDRVSIIHSDDMMVSNHDATPRSRICSQRASSDSFSQETGVTDEDRDSDVHDGVKDTAASTHEASDAAARLSNVSVSTDDRASASDNPSDGAEAKTAPESPGVVTTDPKRGGRIRRRLSKLFCRVRGAVTSLFRW